MSVSINGTGGITFADASTQSTGGYTGFRNRIINGAMMIDQRNAGASVTPTTSAYTLDRWQFQCTQSSKMSIQQVLANGPSGFQSYVALGSLSAYSVGAGDFFAFVQKVEGFNTADLQWGTGNAKTVTLSFWVNCTLTGTFGGSITNAVGNRSYPFTYTVSAANTWQQVSITIAGDTTGTWVGATNGTGLLLYLGMGSGATYSGTAGAWAAGNYVSATGAVSVVGTNGATFYITGVQLEKGSVATPFEFRQYGTELALCQRYYWASSVNATQVVDMLSPVIGGPVTQPIACLPTMRTVPTCSAPSVQASGGITLNSPAVATLATASAMLISGTWSTSAGNRGYVIFNSGNLTASAEL